MFDLVTGIVRRLGYAGIVLLTLAENVFPPLPSELIMPLAGFVASRGELNFWLAVVAGTAGSFAGAVGWYEVGRRVGEDRLRAWVSRHGRWMAVGGGDIDRSAAWFRRHGATAVLVGRLVPGVRTFISLPAGVARMPFWRFTALTVAGCVPWVLALAVIGEQAGDRWGEWKDNLHYIDYVVLAAIVAGVAWLIVRRRRRADAAVR